MAYLLLARKNKTHQSAEQQLWWAVLHRAALDLRYEHDSLAVDALEFLEVTGEWLANQLFDIPPAAFRAEVRGLASKRSGGRSIYSLLR